MDFVNTVKKKKQSSVDDKHRNLQTLRPLFFLILEVITRKINVRLMVYLNNEMINALVYDKYLLCLVTLATYTLDCKNNGTCTTAQNNCTCPADFTGPRFEIRMC